MEEMYTELSSLIDNQRYVISSLSENFRELLKSSRWENDFEVEAPRSSLQRINEIDSEEKEQLKIIEKLLQKAAQIRSSHEKKEQKEKANDENCVRLLPQEHSKQVKKSAAKENKIPIRPNSSNLQSVIPLSQLRTLQTSSTTKPTNGSKEAFRKKPTFLPAHMTAPYKTFAQFKFPAQAKRKVTMPKSSPISHCSIAQLPYCKENPAEQKPILQEHPATEQTTNLDLQMMANEEEVNANVEVLCHHESKHDIIEKPLEHSMKSLKMPAEYLTLMAQNQKLRRQLAKVFSRSSRQNCQSEQIKFFTSLQVHMETNVDPSLKDLLETHKMLNHYGALNRLCHDVGLPAFSDESSYTQLYLIRHYLVTIKSEFEKHASSANELIKKVQCAGRSDLNVKHMDKCMRSRAKDILSRGSFSSDIVYQDLQQIREYQKHYEYLVSLRINKFLYGLLPPYIEHLKSSPGDSRMYRQTYRSIHSLVCSNGRTLPAIVGNLNDDLFEVNDC